MAYRKYHNTKVEIDGHKFDSKAEARRYQELRLLEKAGTISGLELQPVFQLQPTFKHQHRGTVLLIKYIADFKYYEGKRCVVEDVKGFKTKEYELKKKMFLYHYPDVDFREIT